MNEAWTTDEDLRAAGARFASAIPGYGPPAAFGVARRDPDDGLVFGHVNPPGAARPLSAVVLATVSGYVATTTVARLDRGTFARAVDLVAPAEAATHVPHPNLWSWRKLLEGPGTFLAFFVADVADPLVDEDDRAFRSLFP